MTDTQVNTYVTGNQGMDLTAMQATQAAMDADGDGQMVLAPHQVRMEIGGYICTAL